MTNQNSNGIARVIVFHFENLADSTSHFRLLHSQNTSALDILVRFGDNAVLERMTHAFLVLE